MHRSIAILLYACTFSVLVVRPAAAANTGDRLHKVGDFLVRLPIRIPAAAVATVVGTPIAVVRKVKEEIRDTVKGGIDHPIVLLPALASLPFATLGGFWDGMAAGPYDACAYSNKPFSKESFSLGKEMYDSYN